MSALRPLPLVRRTGLELPPGLWCERGSAGLLLEWRRLLGATLTAYHHTLHNYVNLADCSVEGCCRICFRTSQSKRRIAFGSAVQAATAVGGTAILQS